MSNLSYTRPLGVWHIGVIRAAELADLDAKTVKAPNFAEGGAYAPSDVITVGGSGMTVRLVGTNTVSSGALNIESTSSLGVSAGGQFACQGDALYYGTTYILAGVWAFSNGTDTTFEAGSFLNVAGTATFTGAMSVATVDVANLRVSESLFTSSGAAANLMGTLTVAGATHLHETHLHDDTIITGTIILSGAGTIQERCVVGANANATYSVSTADVVWVDTFGQTGSWVYSVDTVGAAEGKKMRFSYFNGPGAFTIEIRRSGTSRIAILANNSGIPESYSWVDIQFISGAWRLVAGGIST